MRKKICTLGIIILFILMVTGIKQANATQTQNLLSNDFTDGSWSGSNQSTRHGDFVIAGVHNQSVESTVELSDHLLVPEIQDGFTSTATAEAWIWNNNQQSVELEQTIESASGNVVTQSIEVEGSCPTFNGCNYQDMGDNVIVVAENNETDYDITVKFSFSVPTATNGHWGADLKNPELVISYDAFVLDETTFTNISEEFMEIEQTLDFEFDTLDEDLWIEEFDTFYFDDSFDDFIYTAGPNLFLEFETDYLMEFNSEPMFAEPEVDMMMPEDDMPFFLGESDMMFFDDNDAFFETEETEFAEIFFDDFEEMPEETDFSEMVFAEEMFEEFEEMPSEEMTEELSIEEDDMEMESEEETETLEEEMPMLEEEIDEEESMEFVEEELAPTEAPETSKDEVDVAEVNKNINATVAIQEVELKGIDKYLRETLQKVDLMLQNQGQIQDQPFYQPKDIYIDQVVFVDNREIYQNVAFDVHDPIVDYQMKVNTNKQAQLKLKQEIEKLKWN